MLAVEMLSEPVVIDDIYVSGLAHVEDMGDGNYRLFFYARQASAYGGEDMVIRCKLVATPSAMLEGVKTVLRALGRKCCGAGLGRKGLH